MKAKLAAFIQNNFKENDIYLRIIINSNILTILNNELRNFKDKGYYIASKILINEQKKRNQIFLSEIKIFLDRCFIRNLKPVFMKGIFLATDIYDNIDERISSDNDIFINVQDIIAYHDVYVKLGYKLIEYEADQTEQELIKHLSISHLTYQKYVNGMNVCFEVHGSIVNPVTVFNINIKEFLGQIKQVNLLNLKPYIFKHEYNLIVLILHFFKHLPCLYLHNAIFKIDTIINLLNLNDIALYVCKHRNVIDWDKLIGIIHSMQVSVYVGMVCTWVNEIYGEIFNEKVIAAIVNNRNDIYMLDGNYEYLGMGKFLWLFNLVIKDISTLPITDLLRAKLPKTLDLIQISKLGSNTNYLHINNKVLCLNKDYYIKLSEEHTSTVSVNVKVEKKYIEVRYNVKNKQCCLYEGRGEFYDYDSIEFIIIRKKHIIHRMFTLSNTLNRPSLIMSSYNANNKEIPICKLIKYDFTIKKDEFEIYLCLPWKAIDVNLDSDSYIPFNISGVLSNPFTSTILANCNLFNDDNYIWDFRGTDIICQ